MRTRWHDVVKRSGLLVGALSIVVLEAELGLKNE